MIIEDPVQARARHMGEEKKMEQTSSRGSPDLAEDAQPLVTPPLGERRVKRPREGTVREQDQATQPQGRRASGVLTSVGSCKLTRVSTFTPLWASQLISDKHFHSPCFKEKKLRPK